MKAKLCANNVLVQEFDKIGEDERGGTYSFSLCRAQQDFILITRKVGTLSGNTYHEGNSIATSPKVFVLLKGCIEFSYRHINDDIKTVIQIDSPSLIEVKPRVTHSVRVIEDCIMLEANSIDDISGDRIKEIV